MWPVDGGRGGGRRRARKPPPPIPPFPGTAAAAARPEHPQHHQHHQHHQHLQQRLARLPDPPLPPPALYHDMQHGGAPLYPPHSTHSAPAPPGQQQIRMAPPPAAAAAAAAAASNSAPGLGFPSSLPVHPRPQHQHTAPQLHHHHHHHHHPHHLQQQHHHGNVAGGAPHPHPARQPHYAALHPVYQPPQPPAQPFDISHAHPSRPASIDHTMLPPQRTSVTGPPQPAHAPRSTSSSRPPSRPSSATLEPPPRLWGPDSAATSSDEAAARRKAMDRAYLTEKRARARAVAARAQAEKRAREADKDAAAEGAHSRLVSPPMLTPSIASHLDSDMEIGSDADTTYSTANPQQTNAVLTDLEAALRAARDEAAATHGQPPPEPTPANQTDEQMLGVGEEAAEDLRSLGGAADSPSISPSTGHHAPLDDDDLPPPPPPPPPPDADADLLVLDEGAEALRQTIADARRELQAKGLAAEEQLAAANSKADAAHLAQEQEREAEALVQRHQSTVAGLKAKLRAEELALKTARKRFAGAAKVRQHHERRWLVAQTAYKQASVAALSLHQRISRLQTILDKRLAVLKQQDAALRALRRSQAGADSRAESRAESRPESRAGSRPESRAGSATPLPTAPIWETQSCPFEPLLLQAQAALCDDGTAAGGRSLRLCTDVAMGDDNLVADVQVGERNEHSEVRQECHESRPQPIAKPGIDPSVAFCPYAWSGECRDANCPFQHLDGRTPAPAQPPSASAATHAPHSQPHAPAVDAAARSNLCPVGWDAALHGPWEDTRKPRNRRRKRGAWLSDGAPPRTLRELVLQSHIAAGDQKRRRRGGGFGGDIAGGDIAGGDIAGGDMVAAADGGDEAADVEEREEDLGDERRLLPAAMLNPAVAEAGCNEEFEALLSEHPERVPYWIGYAAHVLLARVVPHSLTSVLDQTLQVLSFGLETNPGSAELWIEYLRLFNLREQPHDTLEMCAEAVAYADSPELWHVCLYELQLPLQGHAALCVHRMETLVVETEDLPDLQQPAAETVEQELWSTLVLYLWLFTTRGHLRAAVHSLHRLLGAEDIDPAEQQGEAELLLPAELPPAELLARLSPALHGRAWLVLIYMELYGQLPAPLAAQTLGSPPTWDSLMRPFSLAWAAEAPSASAVCAALQRLQQAFAAVPREGLTLLQHAVDLAQQLPPDDRDHEHAESRLPAVFGRVQELADAVLPSGHLDDAAMGQAWLAMLRLSELEARFDTDLARICSDAFPAHGQLHLAIAGSALLHVQPGLAAHYLCVLAHQLVGWTYGGAEDEGQAPLQLSLDLFGHVLGTEDGPLRLAAEPPCTYALPLAEARQDPHLWLSWLLLRQLATESGDGVEGECAAFEQALRAVTVPDGRRRVLWRQYLQRLRLHCLTGACRPAAMAAVLERCLGDLDEGREEGQVWGVGVGGSWTSVLGLAVERVLLVDGAGGGGGGGGEGGDRCDGEYRFHNAMAALYLSVLPTSEHAGVYESLRTLFKGCNVLLELSAAEHAWCSGRPADAEVILKDAVETTGRRCELLHRARVAVALGVGKTDHARRMCDQALVKLPCSAALWQLRLGLATDAAERERTAWRAAQQSVFVR